jgi:antitoxin VapB
MIYIMKTAKVFMTGRSQAIRLPKEFRFGVSELSIWRDGENLVLGPIKPAEWPDGFWQKIHISDAGFARARQPQVERRRTLDQAR